MKRIGALLITGALIAPNTASAVGGSLTFQSAKHTFSLQTAHRLVEQRETHEGFPLKSIHCGWVSPHVAGCSGKITVTVLTGGQPETLLLIDYVTRSGACSTHIVERTGAFSGIAHGNSRPHDCFTGPVLVESGPTLLA